MKRYYKIKWVLLILSMGLGVSLNATPQEEQKVLKLHDLIKEALEKNPLQKAAEHEVSSHQAMIGPSGSYEDPMFGFEAKNYPVDTWSRRQDGMTGNEISLSQKIPFPGKLSLLKKATTFEYNSKKETLNQKQLDLIKSVKVAYYEFYLAAKKQSILKDQRSVIRQLIVVARNKYTLGSIPQAELLNLQLEEAELINQLLQAEREIQVKKSNLNYFLGRRESLSGRPEDITITPLQFSKLTPESIADKIQNKNPGLKATHYQVQAASKKLTHAKLGYLPDFEFMLAYMYREPSPGNTRGVDMASGKIGLSIPLWAFTKQSEQIKGARAEKAKADALFYEEQNTLLRSTQTLYSELKEAHKRLDLYKTGILPLARQAIASGKSAYQASKLEYTSLLNLVQQRFQAEYSYHETIVNYENKIAELESLTGSSI
ncbi:MAG: TolC family protein [Deltaproteobacteria bacterium]|nr:TolC family protein [Deltaproteobacteria bacterium]